MRRVSRWIYLTPDEIDEHIKDREAEAAALPDGELRKSILTEIAQLRLHAEAKRWIESPGLKPGA